MINGTMVRMIPPNILVVESALQCDGFGYQEKTGVAQEHCAWVGTLHQARQSLHDGRR
jgi:hypothetical protein